MVVSSVAKTSGHGIKWLEKLGRSRESGLGMATCPRILWGWMQLWQERSRYPVTREESRESGLGMATCPRILWGWMQPWQERSRQVTREESRESGRGMVTCPRILWGWMQLWQEQSRHQVTRKIGKIQRIRAWNSGMSPDSLRLIMEPWGHGNVKEGIVSWFQPHDSPEAR